MNGGNYYTCHYLDGHDWWRVNARDMELITNNKSIHITVLNTTTHGIMKEDGKIVKRVKAELHPNDEYDFEKGVDIVINRLFDIECKCDVSEEVKTDGNFSVRCTKTDDGALTAGEIYTFVGGYSKWDSGGVFPHFERNGIKRFKNIDDLRKWILEGSKFELIEPEVKTPAISDYTNEELLEEIKRRM